MTIAEILQFTKQQLAGMVEFPYLEAEILCAQALKQTRVYLHQWPDEQVPVAVMERLRHDIARRRAGEPMAYIKGYCEFWSLPLIVTKDTLIPRAETEQLVETVLALLPNQRAVKRVADLGTGSGAIGLALAKERPHWEMIATDVSESALLIARKNAQQLGISNISFKLGYWCEALVGEFDLIVSNPPYIAETEWQQYAQGLSYEPQQALLSGQDGLDAIRHIAASATHFLKKKGFLVVEHGYRQAAAVQEIFVTIGYHEVQSIFDLAGHQRIMVGRR